MEPNGTNAIPSRVQAWLDARAPTTPPSRPGRARCRRRPTDAQVTAESFSPLVEFGADLRDRLAKALAGDVPVLPTGAGHDAGILSAFVPTAMLFVRNPTGVSHAPAEHATDEDCVAGVEALATVLEELSCR